MGSKLSISLVQLKAGNNSEKLIRTTIIFFVSFKKVNRNNL